MRYIKEFDTLRAAAVTLVIISHSVNENWFTQTIPLGFIGVGFFFVLSGYLITNILLQSKNDLNQTNGKRLRVFFIRRSLRIFPAYYLFLFLNFFFLNKDLSYSWPYFISYTQNILFFIQAKYAGALSPTWTLAVEEQFYLVWPFAMLLIPDKYLEKFIIGCILFSPVFRILVWMVCKLSGQSSSLQLALMPSNMICLCSGALISFWQFNKNRNLQLINNYIFPAITTLIIGLLLIFIANPFAHSFFQQLLITIYSVWIIEIISAKKNNNPIRWLCSPVTVYIGKISYGMYLYHTIALAIFTPLINTFFSSSVDINYIHFIMSYISVFLFASFSWFLFEKPILHLKKYFMY